MSDRQPRTINPLFASKNRLKLGVFGVNVSNGCSGGLGPLY